MRAASPIFFAVSVVVAIATPIRSERLMFSVFAALATFAFVLSRRPRGRQVPPATAQAISR